MADIPIDEDWFRGRGLAVRPATLFHGPKLVMLGEELKGRWGRYTLKDNSGTDIKIRLKYNIVDPLPKVEMGSKEIVLAPPLKWYEYAWMALPLLLVHGGGALGGFVGAMGLHASGSVFRNSEIRPATKYVFSLLITIAAAVVYLVLAGILLGLIGGAKK